jgi:transcriptional regulator with XRE-family HTH domain
MLLASFKMLLVSHRPVRVKLMITAGQVKAARVLLGLSQGELAEMADLGIATVKRLESALEPRGAVTTILKIQTALEGAGIEFIPAEAGKGPGVRLRREEEGPHERRRR